MSGKVHVCKNIIVRMQTWFYLDFDDFLHLVSIKMRSTVL